MPAVVGDVQVGQAVQALPVGLLQAHGDVVLVLAAAVGVRLHALDGGAYRLRDLRSRETELGGLLPVDGHLHLGAAGVKVVRHVDKAGDYAAIGGVVEALLDLLGNGDDPVEVGAGDFDVDRWPGRRALLLLGELDLGARNPLQLGAQLFQRPRRRLGAIRIVDHVQ